jgi:hypothetical protein
MVSIKDRIKHLEKKVGKPSLVYPYVVNQRGVESIEEARGRALGLLPERPEWQYIIAPARLSETDWVAKYSPAAQD